MRKYVIQKPRQITPFNEPARELRILNKPLWQWQRDLLAPLCDGPDTEIEHLEDVPTDPVEALVVADNLWFDQAFLDAFISEARERRRPVRAAFHTEDRAYLQQGLAALSRSYEQRSDLYYVDLWYFPQGRTAQPIEPVTISSDANEVGYYSMPRTVDEPARDPVWMLPVRSVCPVDSWVHVFFANIVFGVFSEAFRTERRTTSDPLFRIQAGLRSLIERRTRSGSAANVKIGENCSIDESVIFQGPVTIGDNVTIGPGCVITQCVIGDNVTLTHGNHLHMCVISDGCFFPWGASAYFSVFMENSAAGNKACLDMCVVGRNSYIGAGTIFMDFNLLPAPITVLADFELVETQMPVLGSCVGHNCRIGAGLVIHPGLSIESDVVLIPSPTRRVIMKDISYEESDHHALAEGTLHPRVYPRADELSGG